MKNSDVFMHFNAFQGQNLLLLSFENSHLYAFIKMYIAIICKYLLADGITLQVSTFVMYKSQVTTVVKCSQKSDFFVSL